MDEKEAQCRSLLVDWAGVGQEDSRLSQGFGSEQLRLSLKEGQVWGKPDSLALNTPHVKSLGTSTGRSLRDISLGCGIPLVDILVWFLGSRRKRNKLSNDCFALEPKGACPLGELRQEPLAELFAGHKSLKQHVCSLVPALKLKRPFKILEQLHDQ